MTENSELYHTISKLQFHYWFSDKKHVMEALIYNKCERELLELTKALAKVCAVSVNMEVEHNNKGGLKTWLTLSAKTPKKTPASKLAVVNLLLASCIATANQVSIGEVLQQLLNSLTGDKELNKAEREQRKQLFEHLKAEANNYVAKLDQHPVIKKRRSNFFDLLRKYQKVQSISLVLTDHTKKIVTEEQVLLRDHFRNFLLSSAIVAPQIVEQAQIEIISPVLVSGRHKWKGNYNGSPISFVMKSDDFMELVQSGKVEFKSGSAIACTLEIEKKMSSTGAERITGYNIIHVSSYSENGKTIVTTEEKQKQKQQAVSKRQLDLFG
jgi:hypothetical protein